MSIRLEMSVTLRNPKSDPSHSLVEYSGPVVVCDLDESEDLYVGTARAFVVDLEACTDNGFSVLSCLDHLESTLPYLQLLTPNESGSFSPAVRKVLDEPDTYCTNMLIVDRIELLPAYRGRGYGLDAMRVIMAQLGRGCRIAAIKPYPLQFEPKSGWKKELELERFVGTKRATTKRLKDLYAELGFQSVGRTGLMVCGLG